MLRIGVLHVREHSGDILAAWQYTHGGKRNRTLGIEQRLAPKERRGRSRPCIVRKQWHAPDRAHSAGNAATRPDTAPRGKAAACQPVGP